tara:strand:+ start:2576 stop:3883 length:1308 start_codon:yes stop_codon:yes gene_type:complete
MTTTNIYFNYINAIRITFSFLLVAFIFKSLIKVPSVIIEFSLLALLLVFSLLHASQKFKIQSSHSFIFIFFLVYILSHTLFAIFIRPLIYDVDFFTVLQFNLLEFRVSTISYFLPIIFIPLIMNNVEKFENFIISIIKISIVLTIIEQLLSLVGFRGFFENFYASSGVVSSNQIGAKSLGLYRIWSVVGSPQLLGVFHLITLFYLLHKNNNKWAFLSFIAVIFSTSKTAYVILLLVSLLYLFYKRQYLTLFITLIIFVFLSVVTLNYYYYLIENISDSYPAFQKFVGSILGYMTLLLNVEEESAPQAFIPGGPLHTLSSYYGNNILETIFGKGLTYSFMQDDLISNSPLGAFLYLTSDFYILTFFDQYGIIGTFLLTYLFAIFPLIKIFKGENCLYFIPIIFFLSMFHYPPHLPKIMMLLTSYPLYILYLKNNNE